MSDREINQIMFKLGCIETKLESISKALADIDSIKQSGCNLGKEYSEEIKNIRETINSIKSVWRKALLIMAGVGVGSVGTEKLVRSLVSMLLDMN